MKTILVLLTENPRKVDEWRRNFDRYGIDIVAAPVDEAPVTLEALLSGSDTGARVLAVCREQSDLYIRGTRKKSPRRDLELVDNVTELSVYTLAEDGRVESERYAHVSEGYIDRAGGATEEPDGWWDTIFRLKSTGRTYAELRE